MCLSVIVGKENRESAKIVWPMATFTSLLSTHPKRTLVLGYLGYRKRLALSVFSLLCSPKLGTAYFFSQKNF
jgi:hypothetical protein